MPNLLRRIMIALGLGLSPAESVPRLDRLGRRIPIRNPWTPAAPARRHHKPPGWARPALTAALLKRIYRALDRRAKLAAA